MNGILKSLQFTGMQQCENGIESGAYYCWHVRL